MSLSTYDSIISNNGYNKFSYLNYQLKIKNQISSLIFYRNKRSRPITNNFACYLSFRSFYYFTGMTIEHLKSGKVISIDHKTILSFFFN